MRHAAQRIKYHCYIAIWTFPRKPGMAYIQSERNQTEVCSGRPGGAAAAVKVDRYCRFLSQILDRSER
jgi:hypothetical protein